MSADHVLDEVRGPLGAAFGSYAGLAALALAPDLAIAVPVLAPTVLPSATTSPNGGQAMGLNVFTLFVGLGLGSLALRAALATGSPQLSSASASSP